MPAGDDIFCKVHYKTQAISVNQQQQKSPQKLSPQPKASQRKSKQDEKSYFEDSPEKPTTKIPLLENGNLKVEFATQEEEEAVENFPSFGADRLIFEEDSVLHEQAW